MAILCDRCGGLLVRERLCEVDGMSSTEQVDCERCVNCGALEDAIVRANRQPTRPPVRSREPRGPRIQPSGPAVLMRSSTDSNHPEICLDLNLDRPCLPPARSGNRRGDQAHDLCVGYEVDDGRTGSPLSSGGPE
jgi:hypothetical protein